MKETVRTSTSTWESVLLRSRSLWILSTKPPKETEEPLKSFGFLPSPQRFDSMKWPCMGKGDDVCVNAVYWDGDISKEWSLVWKEDTTSVTAM